MPDHLSLSYNICKPYRKSVLWLQVLNSYDKLYIYPPLYLITQLLLSSQIWDEY